MEVGDAQGIGRMHHRAWIDTYGAYLPPDYFDAWTVTDVIDMWIEILETPSQAEVVRLVAESGPAVAGFIAVGPPREVEGRPVGRATELRGLYVARDCLGTGLGQRLLDACLGPDQPCQLWVFEANARARAFYQRNGFRADGATFTDDRFPTLLEVRMVR